MTNYNDGKWHGWNGGECPVCVHSKVEIAWLENSGDMFRRSGLAGDIAFLGNQFGRVIAFRVVKEHREPREYTIDPTGLYIWFSHEDGLIHVREVSQ